MTPKPTGKRVYIDVGHGMKPDRYDPGATHEASGTTEHSLNLLAAEGCKEFLESRGHTVHVDDDKVSNYRAGRDAAGYDAFVSMHHNSFHKPAQGSECLYHAQKASQADRKLATMVSQELASELEIHNRGAKPLRLSVLSGAKDAAVPAAVLAELYFIQDENETPQPHMMGDWSERGGMAIGRAIDEFLS